MRRARELTFVTRFVACRYWVYLNCCYMFAFARLWLQSGRTVADYPASAILGHSDGNLIRCIHMQSLPG
jgi:hypothetical protein